MSRRRRERSNAAVAMADAVIRTTHTDEELERVGEGFEL